VNIGYEWSISPKELEAVVGLEMKVRGRNWPTAVFRGCFIISLYGAGGSIY
jgi:hypothetical protein